MGQHRARAASTHPLLVCTINRVIRRSAAIGPGLVPKLYPSHVSRRRPTQGGVDRDRKSSGESGYRIDTGPARPNARGPCTMPIQEDLQQPTIGRVTTYETASIALALHFRCTCDRPRATTHGPTPPDRSDSQRASGVPRTTPRDLRADEAGTEDDHLGRVAICDAVAAPAHEAPLAGGRRSDRAETNELRVVVGS